MELILIRHGESEGDIKNIHEGQYDLPLTNKGIWQANKMSDYIKENHQIDYIWASPLKRAKQTAELLSETINVTLEIVENLKEKNNGILAGLNKEEAKKKVPVPKGGWSLHEAVEGAESEIDFRFRIEKVLSYILKESKGKKHKKIVIVAHGGTISRILQSLFHMPIGKFAFNTSNTGIHHLELKEEFTFIKYLNKSEHLNEK